MPGPKPKYDGRILALLEERPTLNNVEVSEIVGTSVRNVMRRKKALGLPSAPSGRPRSWTDEDMKTAEFLLDEGTSYADAAETTQIPKSTLKQKVPGKGWTYAEAGQLGYQMNKIPYALRDTLMRRNPFI